MAQARASRRSRFLVSTMFLAALLLALAIGLLTAQGSAASTAGAGNSARNQMVSKAKDGPIVFSGIARPGDHVRIFQGETQLGETVASADGKWQVSVAALPSGRQDVRIQVVPATPAPALRGGGGVTPEPEMPVIIYDLNRCLRPARHRQCGGELPQRRGFGRGFSARGRVRRQQRAVPRYM